MSTGNQDPAISQPGSTATENVVIYRHCRKQIRGRIPDPCIETKSLAIPCENSACREQYHVYGDNRPIKRTRPLSNLIRRRRRRPNRGTAKRHHLHNPRTGTGKGGAGTVTAYGRNHSIFREVVV